MFEFTTNETLLTFDDVCLVPQYSTVASRSDVCLSTGGALKLPIPLISANMDTVSEAKMLVAMHRAGGLGIMHRFMPSSKLKEEVSYFYDQVESPRESLALSVGTNKESYELLPWIIDKARIVCIDIAHGYSEQVIKMIKVIRSISSEAIIIAGNIATADAVSALAEAGASVLKAGIGPGSLCSTRVVTGHGIPQLSAIGECSKVARKIGVEIIADGGIRNSGDIAKSLAAGAHYVMLGSLLAATEESPGEVVTIENQLYKKYRGSASFDCQVAAGKSESKIVPEGVSQFKPFRGSVNDIVYQLVGGLKSACSYSGAHNLEEFRLKSRFVKVSPASRIEGEPHGLLSK